MGDQGIYDFLSQKVSAASPAAGVRISRHAGPPFHRKPGRGFTACRAGVSGMPGQYFMTGPSRE
jgi:hypothetical protein